MQVYLLSAFLDPSIDADFSVRWLQESAHEDPFGQHYLTDDPNQADIILFVEGHGQDDPYLLSIRRHPIYRRFPEKCFGYQDDDVAVAVLRGVYPSIRQRDYLPDRCRSAGYIARLARNDAVRYDPSARRRKWLYSFFGEANSNVRCTLLGNTHADGLVRDTTGMRLWQMEPGPARDQFTTEYAESIYDSQFILCPAGYGPTSYRLFEAMEMGRVPVILSDEWVAPPGPKWDEFSVQIPERLACEISTILKHFSDDHEVMGIRARAAWEQWFAKPVCFHRLVELCADIQATRPRRFSALRAWATLLHAPHLKNVLRSRYRSVIRKFGSTLSRLSYQ